MNGGETIFSESLKEIQQLFGDRADAIGADHVQHSVATNLLAACAVSITCRRVIDICRRSSKIAAEPRRVWNHQPIDESQLIGGVLIIAEVKEFVLDDWTTESESEVFKIEIRNGCGNTIDLRTSKAL